MSHGFFIHNRETNHQSMHWKDPVHYSKIKRGCQNQKSSYDAHVFNVSGIVHVDWVPKSQTRNQV